MLFDFTASDHVTEFECGKSLTQCLGSNKSYCCAHIFLIGKLAGER